MSLVGPLRVLVFLMFLVFGARTARAEPVVALVDPSAAEAERRALVQLRAELEASGYAVVVVEPIVGSAELEEVARAANASAAIRVRRGNSGLLAEIWTRPVPAEPGELATARAEGEGLEASRTLALRSVEILRGRGLASDEDEDEAAPSAVAHRGLSVGLGFGALGHPSGLPTAFATALSFGYQRDALKFELCALSATKSRLHELEGKATLEQALVLGSLRVEPLLGATLSPFFGVTGGAYMLSGQGKALAGLQGKSSGAAWSAAFGGLAGAVVRVHDGPGFAIDLVGRLNAWWLSPQPVVRFVGRPVAKAGQPLVSGTIGAEVQF